MVSADFDNTGSAFAAMPLGTEQKCRAGGGITLVGQESRSV